MPDSYDTSPLENDDDLVTAFLSGYSESFNTLVVRHRDEVFSFFIRMGTTSSDADDLAQETFLKVWHGLPNYRPDAQFSTWLYRIARNVWIDFCRERSRSSFVSLDALVQSETESLHNLPSSETIDSLLKEETLAIVRAEIERLPSGEREIVVLAYMQDLKYGEIAKIIGIPEGTVKSRMHSALHRLKERLTRVGISSTEV